MCNTAFARILLLTTLGSAELIACGSSDGTSPNPAPGQDAAADAVEDALGDALEDAADAGADAAADAAEDTATDTTADATADAVEDTAQDVTDASDDVDAGPLPAVIDIPIAEAVGEEFVPRVTMTAQSHAWVSWYSMSAGNYDVRLQKLGAAGTKLLDSAGVLVSDNASETWVMDHAITHDAQGEAMLAFTDVRSGQFEAYAYKVHADGTQAWGADGVLLSTEDDEAATPKLAALDDGSMVVVWGRMTSEWMAVMVQRISADGEPMWAQPVAVCADPGSVCINPEVVATSDGNILLVWQRAADIMSDDRDLLARKLDPDGESVWNEDRIVNDTHAIPMQAHPVLVADGDGGAMVAWMAAEGGSFLASFIQHVGADGAMAMADQGVRVSSSMTLMQVRPRLAYVRAEDEVVVGWEATTPSQGQRGIRVQRFTPSGEPVWDEEGLEVLEVADDVAGIADVREAGAGVMVFMGEYDTSLQSNMLAAHVPLETAPVPAAFEISSFRMRSHTNVSETAAGGWWVVWTDGPTGDTDILGSFVPVP